MLELKAYIPMKVLPVSLSQGLLDLGIANYIEETAFSNIFSILEFMQFVIRFLCKVYFTNGKTL